MNISSVISQIISQLGLYNITLPFKNAITGETIPTENAIRDVLVNTTIPTFSPFNPWERECTCNLTDLELVSKKDNIYKLPSLITQTDILYVISIRPPMVNTRGTYGDIAPAYGINRSVQGVITSQAYMMLAGQMRAEPTFDYIGENKVRLYGYPKIALTFKVAAMHSPNGESIKDSCRESFTKLATAHVKTFLYNNLKYFKTIPTAHGEITLPIEDWANGESEANAITDAWSDTFHLDMDWVEFM